MNRQKIIVIVCAFVVVSILCGVSCFIFLQHSENDEIPVDSEQVETTPNPDSTGVEKEKLVRVDTEQLLSDLDVEDYTEVTNKEIPYNYVVPEYQGEEHGSAYIQLYTNQVQQTEETLRNYIVDAEKEMGLADAEKFELAYSATDASVIILMQYTSESIRTTVKYVGTTGENTTTGNIQVYAFKMEEY